MSTIVPIQPYIDERDQQERIEWAEQEAGWFFNKATARQKAKFDQAMDVARGCVSPLWDRKREAARKEWAESTKEASALFDRTVEWFISHGEISEELDALWTAMIVEGALAEAAE